MGVKASATATAQAPVSAVWNVLADFENVSQYTDQIKTSSSPGQSTGVGAQRTCELSPAGTTQETIREWVEGESITISVDEVTMMPVKSSLTTFSMKAVDENTTELTMSTDAEPKGGVLKPLIAKRLAKGLPKAAQRLVDDFAAAAEKANY